MWILVKVSIDTLKKIAKIDKIPPPLLFFQIALRCGDIQRKTTSIFFQYQALTLTLRILLFNLRITEVAFKLYNDRCWSLMFSTYYYLSVLLARAYE